MANISIKRRRNIKSRNHLRISNENFLHNAKLKICLNNGHNETQRNRNLQH
jgi:hypothetical protein